MDAIKFLEQLSSEIGEMKNPMSIDEAIRIVDPKIGVTAYDNLMFGHSVGRFVKACSIVAEYARKKRAEENEH